MTLNRFHFETAAQWGTCAFVQADAGALRAAGIVQPFPAYTRTATRMSSSAAYAPAVTPAGDVLWRDDRGGLLRVTACETPPERSRAPEALASATRIVTNASGLWVLSASGRQLQRFDDETLSRTLVIELHPVTGLDIADGDRGTVLVLATGRAGAVVVRVDPAGRQLSDMTLAGGGSPQSFTYLRRTRQLVVLDGNPESRTQRLQWFASDGTPLFARSVSAWHPCFAAVSLGGDGRDRLFVAGADGAAFGARSWVLVLDAQGQLLGDVPIEPADLPVTGVVGARRWLFVSGARGLLRFESADEVPEDAGELRAAVLTPMLTAPDRDDRRRWLRIEATADLPEGTTLEIACAHTDGDDSRNRLARLADDASASAAERIAALLDEGEIWQTTTVFHGRAASASAVGDPLSAPLFGVADRYVWVLVTLRAAPGARLPKLRTLDVVYPGRTLMEHLPAVFQREEERPGSFFRSLVGVLEETTQGLDARIAGMSRGLRVETASGPWLDFVAGWLGVPWDEAMSLAQKRCVLGHAASLTRHRGTRAGLETLLECLFPTPAASRPRYRLTDATADVGFARVGGGACVGSALPAMLGGRTPWSTELGRDSVVGRMRLPCPTEVADGVRHLVGQVVVDVGLAAEERRLAEPWLEPVLRDMVPLGVRLRLRWVPMQALRGRRLDGTLTVDGAPAAELGTGAVTGLARLPERPVRLSAAGPTLGTRLR